MESEVNNYLIKGVSDFIGNIHLNFTVEGWPATVSTTVISLSLASVAISGLRTFERIKIRQLSIE